jgi:hypothetical protein
MKITKEVQYSRPILDIATYLSKQQPLAAIEGIKAFLLGDVTSLLSKIKWAKSTTRPFGVPTLIIDNEYWYPTEPYDVSPILEDTLVNKKCSLCNNYMTAYEVMITCPKANPNGWKSRLECSNLECLHEEYYTKYRKELIDEYGKL